VEEVKGLMKERKVMGSGLFEYSADPKKKKKKAKYQGRLIL